MGNEAQAGGYWNTSAELDRPQPEDEALRLAALRRYNILDSPPEGAFDRIADLAAQFFRVPISTITFVDEDRVWFKARHGLDVTAVPRPIGLCAAAILHDDPWLVCNAVTDPRTLNNELVRGELGVRFYLGAPIITHDGYRLGILNVIDMVPRETSAEEVATLQKLAALVLDELELRLSALQTVAHERERAAAERQEKDRMTRIARTLQRTLLPPELPVVPGVELAAYHQVGSTDEVSGDFYDVFARSDGNWAITVGDVSGKGAEAAALTALVRYTLRGAALRSAAPGAVLAEVSAAVELDQREAFEPKHCTAVLAFIARTDEYLDLTLTNGGHPPAFLVRPGEAEPVGSPGPILGWMVDHFYDETRVRLYPGEVLVFYTDGVTDARRHGDLLGQAGLRQALAEAGSNTAEAAVAAVRRLIAELDQPSPDDIAVVAISMPVR
jgi:sigma-B regulation protein RsbU (phosphoserine phosphatase)